MKNYFKAFKSWLMQYKKNYVSFEDWLSVYTYQDFKKESTDRITALENELERWKERARTCEAMSGKLATDKYNLIKIIESGGAAQQLKEARTELAKLKGGTYEC